MLIFTNKLDVALVCIQSKFKKFKTLTDKISLGLSTVESRVMVFKLQNAFKSLAVFVKRQILGWGLRFCSYLPGNANGADQTLNMKSLERPRFCCLNLGSQWL